MDWGTIGTAVGAAIGASLATFQVRSKFAKSGTDAAGDQSTDFWREESRTIMTEVLEEKFGPIMERQTKILDSMERSHQETASKVATGHLELLGVMKTILELQKQRDLFQQRQLA